MKRMRFWLSVAGCCLLTVVLLSACKRTTKENSKSEELEVVVDDSLDYAAIRGQCQKPFSVDSLFDDFFFAFCTNKLFQRGRIEFPLPVYDAENTRLQIEEEEWQYDPFFVEDGYYTVIFDTPAQMEAARDTTLMETMVERINLNADFVSQYHFGRDRGYWMLSSIRHQYLKDNGNASFLTFYQKFAADSVFQEKSLSPHVKFTTTDPDDELETISGTMEPGQWDMFRPAVIPDETIYNIVYGHPLHDDMEKLFVIRGVDDDSEAQMTFRRHRDRWRLTAISN